MPWFWIAVSFACFVMGGSVGAFLMAIVSSAARADEADARIADGDEPSGVVGG